MTTIVIMPGGFHPFHAGHLALYDSAREAFPGAEVFVAATNDTSARPFPFAVKEKLAKLAGVATGHFVQVKSPFRAEEITSKFDPARDRLIFVRSEKDANKPPQAGGIKRDGSAAYLQPLAGQTNIRPFKEHAYMAYLPTVEFGPGMTSATEIRSAWPTLNEKRKTALVMSLYPKTQANPKLAATVVKMLDTAMGTESVVDEGIEDNYNKNNAGIKAALQAGIKLIPIQPNNDATGNPIYIHDNSGRYTVAVDMGGISVPFYVSTGLGGKASVAVDKWYPFFGIGPDGWINKGSEEIINDFYGSNKLKRVAQVLNNTLGLPSRAKNVSGWSVNRGDGNYFISAVNRGLDPAAKSDRSTKFRDNMLSVLRGLGEPNKYVEKHTSRPKAYAFDKNNPEHVTAFDATSQSEREIAMALAKDPKSQAVAEGLDEAVGGNYLYHSTQDANTAKQILSSGYILGSTKGKQPASDAQTKLPTVSFGRNIGYQISGANVDRDYQVVFVFDRASIETRYKTLGTSQSQTVRGLANPIDTEWGRKVTKLGKAWGLDSNADGKVDYKEIGNASKSTASNLVKQGVSTQLNAPKAGGEFEEIVPTKTGKIPLQGLLVGFYLVPGKAASKDPELLNDPRRLAMIRPNQFVKAAQPQGVAEGSKMLSLDDKIKIYSKHKSQAQQAENRGDYTTADKHKKQASRIYSNIVNLHFGDDGKDAQNTANEYIRKSQGVAEGATVTRIDSKPITDFGSSLKAYKHTDDWSQSGVDTGDDSYWKNKNLKTNTTKGLFAGDPRRTALYATGNAHETRYVEFTQDGQPIVYFDRKDLPAMRSRKTYLTVFDASDFRQLPTGEWFSQNPGKPIKQVPIGDPFKYIASQGWIVRVTDDLDKVFKQVKNMHKAGKIVQYGAEGMNESKQGVAENFADGRNPQDKGDAKRHGVPTKASVSTLRKVAKQGGRKGQLAHWMANMKAGRAKNEDADSDYIEEKWSSEYKSSINCADPKGFSQKAHCAGRKK